MLGFVRLLRGYYIIFITKRKEVGNIGYHRIYAIEDQALYYIPNDSSFNKNEKKFLINMCIDFD